MQTLRHVHCATNRLLAPGVRPMKIEYAIKGGSKSHRAIVLPEKTTINPEVEQVNLQNKATHWIGTAEIFSFGLRPKTLSFTLITVTGSALVVCCAWHFYSKEQDVAVHVSGLLRINPTTRTPSLYSCRRGESFLGYGQCEDCPRRRLTFEKCPTFLMRRPK